MVSEANPNPNYRKPLNAYHVGGIQVEFPYQPYGSQLVFMCRVISTLDRAQRDGHCHALLESPTGTGKSLSLLCSTLAWQQNCKLKNQLANISHSKPDTEAVTDPLANGGGFIPESQPSTIPPSTNGQTAQVAMNNKNVKKKMTPTIFYASRTHSQISQVISEYKKTAYRVPMAVLASRKHYCTNKYVRDKENIDEECKLLLGDRNLGCPQFKNVHKVRGHPSLQKGGCHEVHDIEDLVNVGQVVRGCSYYAARSMADDAQLVFCPYSYIINPVIRGAMEVDIKGAILILDEAHNIEDIARDAGSVDIDEDVLLKLQMELEQVCSVNPMIYQPLIEMTQDLVGWIERRKATLAKREFQHFFSCWTGDKALRELQEANISRQCFPILLECATKAIKEATDTESELPHLSGMSVITLEGLFSSLTYFFSRNGSHVSDYQLALQKYIKRDSTSFLYASTHLSENRTLSPMNSFSSELGVQFGTCLEAPHVIDVDLQVLTSVISTGPDNYPLNASYKTADGYAFQDALGKSIEEICNVVPGGSLVFFPSYKLMEKLCNRWRETGQWSRLNAKKPLFVEPKGGSQEDFEIVLKHYYNSISQGSKCAVVRKKRVKREGNNDLNTIESQENANKKGASFLAVCRGKVSEGIDFSDDNARVVVTVLNYLFMLCLASTSDERFQEERNRAHISKWLRKSIKQYDSFDASLEGLKSFFRDVKGWVGKKMFNGLENSDNDVDHVSSMDQCKEVTKQNTQELNKSDHSGQNVQSISKYDPFSHQKSQGNFEVQTSLQTDQNNSCIEYIDLERMNDKNNHSIDSSKGSTRKENKKLNSYDNSGQKLHSSVKYDSFPGLNLLDEVEVQEFVQLDRVSSCKDYINTQCSLQKSSRCCEASSMPFSNEDPELLLVKETPAMDDNNTMASPGSLSKDGNSSSTIFQASTQSPDQLSVHSQSLTNPVRVPSSAQPEMVVTPEKEVTGDTSNLPPERDSSLSSSVNSHTQKRRKTMVSPSVDLMLMASREANRRIEFNSETNYVKNKSKTSNNCAESHLSSTPVMDKTLQISCSLCRSPLGLPENHLYVRCSVTSSAKAHLVSLLKQRQELCANVTSIPVIMTDISSVDQLLTNQSFGGASGQGIWCEEDGCVYNTLFCPFCSSPSNCLGVQIVASNALNFQLLNKILFYLDRLEIRIPESGKFKSEAKLLITGHYPAINLKFSFHNPAAETTKERPGFLMESRIAYSNMAL
ncbi:Helicase ATP-binding domain-containing protein [Citrus sinensis]|uniref:Helicase ATP-binding domain-containing protein n=1 Tax=Citrus sinensis TaxID=2711 RepID=A0ACB8KYZ8_CITSI|nr:Helicase ATP-binding domain-containing protein [Citrus sinensis]KAH9759615.1 Helicase ATP-binding domain-containing protein [Citrus sinensis]